MLVNFALPQLVLQTNVSLVGKEDRGAVVAVVMVVVMVVAMVAMVVVLLPFKIRQILTFVNYHDAF
jgi:hypothetical protein